MGMLGGGVMAGCFMQPSGSSCKQNSFALKAKNGRMRRECWWESQSRVWLWQHTWNGGVVRTLCP